jgi:hypothetical protein
MSLTIPTDSLNKFLAIGSLVAMVYMTDVCLKNYEKAELARISAYINLIDFRDKYKDFAELTNKGIDIYNKANGVKKNIPKDDFMEAKEALTEAHNMLPDIDKLILKSHELVKKAELYNQLKLTWFWLTFLVFSVCLFTTYLGFRGWYKSEK